MKGTYGSPQTPPLIRKNNYINSQHNKRRVLKGTIGSLNLNGIINISDKDNKYKHQQHIKSSAISLV